MGHGHSALGGKSSTLLTSPWSSDFLCGQPARPSWPGAGVGPASTEGSADGSWSLARGRGLGVAPRWQAAPPTADRRPEGFILSSYPRPVAPAAPGLGLPSLLQALSSPPPAGP